MSSYDRFLELLEKKGVKSSDVAKATGISTSTLTDWKKGRTNPKMDKLILLSKYFDVDLDYLLGNTSIEKRIPVIKQPQENLTKDIVVGDVVINLDNARKISMSAKECLDLFENASPEVRDFVLSVLRQSQKIPSLHQ